MKKLPAGFSQESLRAISDRTGVPASTVSFLADCYCNQMRKLDPVSIKGRLIVELPQIARDYGTRYDLPENVLTECIFLIVEKFNHLAISEIREAYRQHAAGVFEAKGAEMWGGEFSAAQLGKVLTAYTENRKAVIGEIIRQQQEAQEAARREAQSKALREAFESGFELALHTARQQAKSWQDIPAFWFDACRRRGWLKLTVEEAENTLSRSRLIAQNEEQTDLRSMFEKGANTDERAKVIARKLTVYEWLKSENFKI